MGETDRGEQKTVSWGTVLLIAGIVFFVIGLLARAPAVWIIAAVLAAAGAASQLVSDRRESS
jgi:hypothetical protein